MKLFYLSGVDNSCDNVVGGVKFSTRCYSYIVLVLPRFCFVVLLVVWRRIGPNPLV